MWRSCPHNCGSTLGLWYQLWSGAWGPHPYLVPVTEFPSWLQSAAILHQQSICIIKYQWKCLIWSHRHCLAVDSCDHGLHFAAIPFLWGNHVSNKEAWLILALTHHISGAVSCPVGWLSAPLLEHRRTSEGVAVHFFSPAFLQMHPTQNVISIIFVIISDSCDPSSSFIFLHIITSMEQKYTSAAHLSANRGSLPK